MTNTELAAPPGYQSVVPLDKERHAGLGVASRGMAAAGELNAIYVTATEFPQASRHYPLVFVREAASEELLPMAVTGLVPGRNLFVVQEGAWEHGVYVPAYVRRYPFCVAVVAPQAQGAESQSVICVDESALEPTAQPLFDERGEPTDRWREAEKFLADMEQARQITARLCRELDDLDLVEPFEAQAVLNDGGQFHLKNMFRVTEERLRGVPGDVLEDLVANSDLGRIYAHVMSLDNFTALIDRAVKRG